VSLDNPFVVTIGGTAHSLKRINQDNYGSVFQKLDTSLEIIMTVRHSYETRKPDGSQIIRHNVDLSYTVFDVDGKPTVYQAYVICRTPRGKDPVVATNVLDALGVLVDAESAAIVDWES
jgi:predicted component of type VI protein secretion system